MLARIIVSDIVKVKMKVEAKVNVEVRLEEVKSSHDRG
jgi:hypothetical protein